MEKLGRLLVMFVAPLKEFLLLFSRSRAGLRNACFVVSGCLVLACQSSPPPEPLLPTGYQKEGLVTSNTYQIHLTVLADSKAEAAALALPRARKRAVEMILQEPSVRAGLSVYSRNRIEDLVKRKGSVVYAVPRSEEKWLVVFQVYKRGLWDFLRKMY